MVSCASQQEQVFSAEEYYERGLRQMQAANYESAVTEFQQIEFLYPLSNYVQPAKLQIVSAHYGLGEYGDAADSAKDFIAFYPAADQREFAYYMLARSQYADGTTLLDRFNERDMQNFKEAFLGFKRLTSEYPNSEWTAEARAHMRHIRNALAADDLKTARFYYSRKAYVAAVNHGLYVIRNYPRAPAVADALELLTDAYRSLELDEHAVWAQQLFDSRFTDRSRSSAPLEKTGARTPDTDGDI